jgi:hypothetical protein
MDLDSQFEFGPPPEEDAQETSRFRNALQNAATINATPLEKANINTGVQNKLLEKTVPNPSCSSPAALCPYLGISPQEFKTATRKEKVSSILSTFNHVDFHRFPSAHVHWASVAQALQEMNRTENRKYLNPTVYDLSGTDFDMYKVYAWAITELHRELYSSSRAMFANRGVPFDMEHEKVYAVLKYFKKLYRERKQKESKNPKPQHEKGESRVVEGVKNKSKKKDRTPITSAQDRLEEILESRRGRGEVARLADGERRAALELDSNPDEVQKIKSRKDIQKQKERVALAEEKISEALAEYDVIMEERRNLENSFDDEDDPQLRIDLLDQIQEREDHALENLSKLRDEQHAATQGKLEDVVLMQLKSVNRHGIIEKTSKRNPGTFDDHKTPKYTIDSRNPRATWFKDGRVIGGTNTYDLLDYTEVDWVDGDRPGPNPFPGRADVNTDVASKPATSEVTAKRTTSGPATSLQPTAEDEATEEIQAVDEDLTAAEEVRAKAREARMERAKSIYAATWFEHGEGLKDSAEVATEEPLSKSEFAKVLLSGAHLEAATLVPADRDSADQPEADDGSVSLGEFTDPLSERFVAQEEWAGKLARESAMVPTNLRKAFTTLRVKHRSQPNIPNQDGRPPLPWQSLGAAEGVERQLKWTIDDRVEETTITDSSAEEDAPEQGEVRSTEKNLEQAKKAKSEKRREARRLKRARKSDKSDDPRGLLFADVVGIGKTDTVLLKRGAVSNIKSCFCVRGGGGVFQKQGFRKTLFFKNTPPPPSTLTPPLSQTVINTTLLFQNLVFQKRPSPLPMYGSG